MRGTHPETASCLDGNIAAKNMSDPLLAYLMHLEGHKKSIWQATNGILGLPESTKPTDVCVGSCFVDGNCAILEVTGKIENVSVCGRVVLRYYADDWYVLSEDYVKCTPSGQCLKVQDA